MGLLIKAKYVTLSKTPEITYLYTSGNNAARTMHRVLSFDNVEVPASRKIFLDKAAGKFYYLHSNSFVYEYKVSWNNLEWYQQITMFGTTYQVSASTKTIFEWNSSKYTPPKALTESKIKILKVGANYRLANDTRVKIVAFVTAEDGFCTEGTFIGVYQAKDSLGTIRFSIDGQLLSHGGDKNYFLESEWKEEILWSIVYRDQTGVRRVITELDSENTITEEGITKSIKANGGTVIKIVNTKI